MADKAKKLQYGDKIWWLKDEKRGWGGTRRIGGKFLYETGKRVTIEVEMADGTVQRKSVKEEKIIPMDDTPENGKAQLAAPAPATPAEPDDHSGRMGADSGADDKDATIATLRLKLTDAKTDIQIRDELISERDATTAALKSQLQAARQALAERDAEIAKLREAVQPFLNAEKRMNGHVLYQAHYEGFGKWGYSPVQHNDNAEDPLTITHFRNLVEAADLFRALADAGEIGRGE
jgi:hypothetical protein